MMSECAKSDKVTPEIKLAPRRIAGTLPNHIRSA